MVKSHWRGNEIYFKYDSWYYSTDNKLVSDDKDRKCGYCKMDQTAEGHDGCLGTLPNVMNACCGHGVPSECYVQLLNSKVISGKENVEKWLRRDKC